MSSINTSCNQCGTKNCPKMCSGCKKVYYCDKNCQVKNWKAHKSVCLKNSVDLDHSKGDVTVAETEKVMKELVPLESSLVLCPNADELETEYDIVEDEEEYYYVNREDVSQNLAVTTGK